MKAFLKRLFSCIIKFFGKLLHRYVCKRKTSDDRKDDEI
nr:MAG TPA: hypothetical protein [Picobirnaviridae sp.]